MLEPSQIPPETPVPSPLLHIQPSGSTVWSLSPVSLSIYSYFSEDFFLRDVTQISNKCYGLTLASH